MYRKPSGSSGSTRSHTVWSISSPCSRTTCGPDPASSYSITPAGTSMLRTPASLAIVLGPDRTVPDRRYGGVKCYRPSPRPLRELLAHRGLDAAGAVKEPDAHAAEGRSARDAGELADAAGGNRRALHGPLGPVPAFC